MGDEDVGALVVDVRAEEEDTVFEEARDDVHLAGRGVDHGHADGGGGWVGGGVLAPGVDFRGGLA